MNVLIVLKHRFSLWTAPEWFVAKLHTEFPDVTFENRRSYDNIEDVLRDADVVVSWSLKPEQVRVAKRLKWIHSTAAAIHQLMIPQIADSNIVLTNARSVHGPVVAEHALALMFALAKRLPSAFRMQQKHEWGQDAMTQQHPPLREMRESTLGLVGVGCIGGYLARMASSMGMRAIAVRANPDKGVDWLPANDAAPARHRVYGPKDLNILLKESDFVVISAPVTEQTKRIIDAEGFATMKPTAYLVNVARGALVDEQALIAALREKRIGGAALDVFEDEPLPPTSPLWDLDNVVITPHSAGISQQLWERQYKLFSENLRRFQTGAPLIGLVNKQAGY